MVFSSLMFMFIFLPVVLTVYYILPKRFRNIFLLAADLFFYGWGEPVLVLLMVFSIVVNYFAGLLIEKHADKKKAILIVSVIIDLGLLAFFKYAGFIANNLRVILPFAGIPEISVPLPIGISFYTFQIMSYTIDVYRGDTSAQHNIVDFGTYVSLFPQLIAGPIVKYRDVASQFKDRHENIDLFAKGVRLFLLGLGKKVLLANPMGLMWDSLREASQPGSLGAFMGILSFSLQIYFDFSGYSDMARGLGNMLGFEFHINFDYPYISESITEFWRRWHISLGTWFREYVYIPLGGNRKGKVRTVINLLIVWMLTGFWHGASWNFLLWGLYFGILLIIEKTFLLNALEKVPRIFRHIYALVFIILGWMLFYFSDDVGGFPALGSFAVTLFSGGASSSEVMHTIASYLPLTVVGIIASTPLLRRIYEKIKDTKICAPVEIITTAAVLILCTASLVSAEYNPFLYFKF